MNGHISKFREDIGIGVIVADDGRKYRFAQSDIKNSDDGMIGQNVDFIVVGSRPAEIIVMSGSAWTAFGGLSRA